MIRIPVLKIPVLNLTTAPFDLLLAALGVRMQQLSYTNEAFQALIDGRAFTLQIEAEADGIARHYRIKDGKVCHRGGMAKQPDFTLRFKDSDMGISTLTKGDPTAFMLGMQAGTIQMEGDFSLLMWFNQAAKLIAPNIPKPVLQKIKQAQRFVAEKRAAFKQA